VALQHRQVVAGPIVTRISGVTGPARDRLRDGKHSVGGHAEMTHAGADTRGGNGRQAAAARQFVPVVVPDIPDPGEFAARDRNEYRR
jgi:hypothetical protein